MATTTSATRMLAILLRLADQPDDVTVRGAWERALDIKKDDNVALVRAIAQVHELLEAARQDIVSCPDLDHELFLSSFPVIQQILDPSYLRNSWSTYKQQLTAPHVLLGLRFCEAELKKRTAEGEISTELLDSLLKEVGDNMRKISKDTSLPPALRSLLLEHLGNIQQSILDYRVSGCAGLKRAVESAIGGLIAHRSLLKGYEESDGLGRTLGTIRSAARLLEEGVGLASKGFQLMVAIKDGLRLLN